MKNHLEKIKINCPKLFAKTPDIFMEVGDGWYNLINDLCVKIEKEINLHNTVNMEIFEIKEKFGIWNDYIYNVCVKIEEQIDLQDIENIEIFQIKEKFGTLRFYLSNENKVIGEYVIEVELKSCQICEVCGEQGRMDKTNGWWKTLCSEHLKERINKYR